MSNETEVKPMITVSIYLKSGNVITITNFTQFDAKWTAHKVTNITWEQDFERAPHECVFVYASLDQIEAILYKETK